MPADRVPLASTHAVRRRADEATFGYLPHRPTDTVLHALVRDHLESFLDHARQNHARGLPRYVEQAFRDYLTCGVFAHGFLRLHCDHCRRDLLVAFSCQGRGLCPSCASRYADGCTETVRAGEVYYWPAGHTVWTDEDYRAVEFSPADGMRAVMDHLREKLGVTESA